MPWFFLGSHLPNARLLAAFPMPITFLFRGSQLLILTLVLGSRVSAQVLLVLGARYQLTPEEQLVAQGELLMGREEY